MKTLIWDFDGTLAYREGMWTAALIDVLRRHGFCEINHADVRPFTNIGFTWNSPDTPLAEIFGEMTWWEYYEKLFENIFIMLRVKHDIAEKMSKEVKKEYLRIEKWHVFDDVVLTLNALQKNGYKNIILSNHIPELVELVTKLKLADYFSHIFSSGNIGYEKPNKAIFQYAVKNARLDCEKCIMIGDNYGADVAGALRCGIKAIWVRAENNKEYKWHAKDLNDLSEVLNNIN